MPYLPKEATPATVTVTANREALTRYDMDDRGDFGDADAGLIAPWPDQVVAADGHVIFDPAWFDFVDDDIPAPDTVNPSLWRQAQLMRRGGCTRSPTASTRPETTTSRT